MTTQVIRSVLADLLYWPLRKVAQWLKANVLKPILAALSFLLWLFLVLSALCMILLLYVVYVAVLFLAISVALDLVLTMRYDREVLYLSMGLGLVAVRDVTRRIWDGPYYHYLIDPASRLRPKATSSGRRRFLSKYGGP